MSELSDKFSVGSQPEGRQRTLAANLIDLQRLPASHREALPALGTNLGQKSIFSLAIFREIRAKQFTQLSCRLARTLDECARAIFSQPARFSHDRKRDATEVFPVLRFLACLGDRN